MSTASAVSGVATVEISGGGGVQVSIVPVSAAGTASIEIQPFGAPGFEPARDSSENNITGISLAAQTTYVIDGRIQAVRVTSTNSSDTFSIIAVA